MNKCDLKKVMLISTLLIGGSLQAAPMDGEDLYQRYCISCHIDPVWQAPNPEVAADWQGKDLSNRRLMVERTYIGYGNMPARGGDPTVDWDMIDAAVGYMISQAKKAQKRR